MSASRDAAAAPAARPGSQGRAGTRRAAIVAALFAALSAPAGADNSRTNYLLHCSGCHGFDGSGAPAAGVPSMKGAIGHFLRTPDGRAFLVQVPGTANSALGDADVATLLNWIVTTMSPAEVPAEFRPYTTAEVTRLRSNRPVDIPATRERIVRELQAQGYTVR